MFFARLFERFVHFLLEGNSPGEFGSYLITTFSWHRFSAVSLWILVLFLIYVMISEFSNLFGPGEIRRLLLVARHVQLSVIADRGENNDPAGAPNDHGSMVRRA
jgi:hypothetical protein